MLNHAVKAKYCSTVLTPLHKLAFTHHVSDIVTSIKKGQKTQGAFRAGATIDDNEVMSPHLVLSVYFVTSRFQLVFHKLLLIYIFYYYFYIGLLLMIGSLFVHAHMNTETDFACCSHSSSSFSTSLPKKKGKNLQPSYSKCYLKLT